MFPSLTVADVVIGLVVNTVVVGDVVVGGGSVVSMHNASPCRCSLMSACFTADTNSGKIPKNVMRQFLCRGGSVIISQTPDTVQISARCQPAATKVARRIVIKCV